MMLDRIHSRGAACSLWEDVSLRASSGTGIHGDEQKRRTDMRRYLLLTLISVLLFDSEHVPVYAENAQVAVLLSQAVPTFDGTWRSGNFAFTFYGNGKYVYVGAMGNTSMSTQISEEGTFAISGDKLIVSRQRGVITNSQHYKQELQPSTTVYHWRLGNTERGPGLQLQFPNGGTQIFYKQ
jgi:hypothetical protein